MTTTRFRQAAKDGEQVRIDPAYVDVHDRMHYLGMAIYLDDDRPGVWIDDLPEPVEVDPADLHVVAEQAE